MEEIIFVESIDTLTGEKLEGVTIHHGDGRYTSMTKAAWNELEAIKENSPTKGGN